MKEFNKVSFKGKWRPYQQRVLENLEKHLNDKKLHLVAAPGAGKTTLGLEVFVRLKKKALILAPTRIIRDQWLNRFADFTDDSENLCSNDINNTATLTSITYQALFALAQRDKNDFSSLIKKEGIGVIILDEAHHLTGQWWKILNEITEENTDLKLVTLTATPPYDVTGYEWKRYQSLCGPVDEEISIPELVKENNLVPHQDYIWPVKFDDEG